jgi:hypothetical protein
MRANEPDYSLLIMSVTTLDTLPVLMGNLKSISLMIGFVNRAFWGTLFFDASRLAVPINLDDLVKSHAFNYRWLSTRILKYGIVL